MARSGGKRDKAQLTYDKSIYTPIGAKTLSESELRKEYSRLRSIANKRLKRFEGTEWTDTQQYIQNAGKYKKLSELKSDTELRHLLSDVARFITADTGSVSGLVKQRDRMIKTMNDRGMDFVNKQNYRDFVEFMEYTRTALVGRWYDSDEREAIFLEAYNRGIRGDELKQIYRKWSKKENKRKGKVQNKDPRKSDLFRDGDFL